MRKSAIRSVVLLMVLLLLLFGCMGIANSIQTDHGNINISRGTIDLDTGSLTFKLYEPVTATAENPAPGVLLLHGYQNDHETCAAYAIELARRGVVVMSLDEYGHGSSTAGLLNRGYVNHRVKVNFGEDSVEDGTFVEAGSTKRYRLLMNFSKEEYIGSAAWYFLILNWLKLPLFALDGRLSPEVLRMVPGMLPFLVLGAALGVVILHKLPHKWFQRVIQVFVFAGALRLLWMGLAAR